ncbi:hypothetical protein BJ742DRAFT_844837 [Cladochytrium replicatum]|nr:hypothetical protein BJ742DRAFT_844837 [Cladochytrium replicatum]
MASNNHDAYWTDYLELDYLELDPALQEVYPDQYATSDSLGPSDTSHSTRDILAGILDDFWDSSSSSYDHLYRAIPRVPQKKLPQGHTPPRLPLELIDYILIILGRWGDNPILAFRAATQLRRRHVQARIIDLIISVDIASERGFVGVLDMYKERRTPMVYTSGAMDNASGYGHTNILEWWKASDLKMLWSAKAMGWASIEGHVAVLEWWKQSGLELKYNVWVMPMASKHGHVDVLEWWKSSGLPIKWTDHTMDYASKYGHVHVLEWWKQSGLALKYSVYALPFASENGNVAVLEWWKTSGLELKWSDDAMEAVWRSGNTEVIEWWRKSGLIDSKHKKKGGGALKMMRSWLNMLE